ncbi:MAG: hypothetical protein V7641_1432 [Blastocatellia bacterium]
MLSPEEKEKIRERIQFEDELREALSTKEPSWKESIWNKASSGLGLLILGSIITGVLVPIFQNRQKTLEWERQVRYENVKYDLEMRRECLKEFMLIGAFLSQFIELVQPYMNEKPISKKDYEELDKKLREIQSERFKQNAKVIGLLIYYSDYSIFSRMFNEYTRAVTDYLNNDINRFLFLKYHLSERTNSGREGDLSELRALLQEIDDTSSLVQKFNEVSLNMLKEIRIKEDEYANTRF